MKKSKKVLIFSGYAMLLGLILACAVFFSGAKISGVSFGKNGAEIIHTDKHIINKNNLSPFESLDLNIQDANVNLIPSDHYGASYSYYRSGDAFNCSVKNGKLEITNADKYKGKQFFIFDLTSADNDTINVYYPQNAGFKNLNVKNKNGNVTAAGFKSEKTCFNIPYGSINISNASCGNINIVMKNGGSVLKNIKTASLDYNNAYGKGIFQNVNVEKEQNVRIISKEGSLNFNGFICNSLEINNKYGDIDLDSLKVSNLKSILNNGNFTMKNSDVKTSDVKNSYGKVTMNAVELGGADIQCKNGSIYMDGKIQGKTRICSEYGEIRVNTSLPQSQYAYTAVSYYGSVRINGKKEGSNATKLSNAKNTLSAEAKNGDTEIEFAG